MPDYYEILGVSREAGPDQIKKAFREMALKYHPDRNAGNPSAEDQFKKINEAYSVLGDPEKKNMYDMGAYSNGSSGFDAGSASYGRNGGDPWEEFFGSQAGEAWRQSSWTWTNRQNYTAPERTRKDAFEMLFRSVITLLMGVVLFRFSFFFGIFGVVLCIAAIGRGFMNSLRAIHLLFSLRE